MYDSCKGMTGEQKHVKKVDGKTLFDLVSQELALLDVTATNKKIGAVRWRELKAPFLRRVDNTQDAFNVAVAEAEAVSPALMKAVIACKKQNPDRSQLFTFLLLPCCRSDVP